MPKPFSSLLRPLPLLAVGLAVLCIALLAGETVDLVGQSLGKGSPLREVTLIALGLVAVGALWFLAVEARRWMRLRRVERLKEQLAGEGRASPELRVSVAAWLTDLEQAHDAELQPVIAKTRSALAHCRNVAGVRQCLDSHLMGELDERVEREIRRSALRLGLASSFLSIPVLDGVLTLVFSLRLVRRVAALHGARPGVTGTMHLLREVALAVVAADLSQHAADAISTRVGGLAAAAGQSLVTATLVVRVGLWTMSVCRPLPLDRPGLGSFVVRGAASELTHCVRGGVQRAMGALRSS